MGIISAHPLIAGFEEIFKLGTGLLERLDRMAPFGFEELIEVLFCRPPSQCIAGVGEVGNDLVSQRKLGLQDPEHLFGQGEGCGGGE